MGIEAVLNVGPGPDHERKRIIQHSNKSSEWYTPSWILDAAREVLGHLDLDPASSIVANETVQASQWYSERNSGLGKHWWTDEKKPASIWLNPPSPAILWWKELMFNTRFKYTKHALFMAYNVQLAQVSQGKDVPSILDFPVCWFSKRVRFIGAGSSPANASALVYVPGTIDRTEQFMLSFSQYGAVTGPLNEANHGNRSR